MARVHTGVSEEHFKAVIDTAFKSLASDFVGESRIDLSSGRDGVDENRDEYRKVLVPLLGTVGVMLAIACANLAGMLLARGSAREQELSIRRAIGAGRGRIVRQLVAECLLLTSIGGIIGICAAGWGGVVLGRVLAGSASALNYDVHLDLRVLSFALALIVVTALLSGVYPAIKAVSLTPRGTRTVKGASSSRLKGSLVVAQICLSLVLVVVAGLYVRTLGNLMAVAPGFSIEDVLLFNVNPGNLGMTDPEIKSYYSGVQDALRLVPGVTSATVMAYPFLANTSQVDDVEINGSQNGVDARHQAHSLIVGESFFDTLGLRLLSGRSILPSDTTRAPKVVLVNATFARKFLAGETPIGRSISVRGDEWRIVGVCADARYERLWQVSPPHYVFFVSSGSIAVGFLCSENADSGGYHHLAGSPSPCRGESKHRHG